MDKRIVILGAGISGLALAWSLKKKHGNSIHCTIVEKSSRTGGWIQSIHKEGFLFELGPRSCRTGGNGIATLRLIEELGIQDHVIAGVPEAQCRYLYIDGKLQQIPSSFVSMLFSPLSKGLFKAICNDLFTQRGTGGDESIHAFISRRFSAEIAERFMDPLCSGIYAGDIRKLSVQACFPLLTQWEQEQGSVTKGALFGKRQKSFQESSFIKQMTKNKIFSFKMGMQTLTDALTSQLECDFLLSSEAKELRLKENGIEVGLEDGRVLEGDHVYFTLPAMAVSELLAPYCKGLESVPSTSVAVVNLGYRSSVLKNKGFGYLVPSREQQQILGVVWDSAIFPQQNCAGETRLTVMMGGDNHPDMALKSEEKLADIALRSISKHMGIDAAPDSIHVHIAKEAIPQYHVGHGERVNAMQQGAASLSPRLTILGSSYYGVAVNDCIAKANQENFHLSSKNVLRHA